MTRTNGFFLVTVTQNLKDLKDRGSFPVTVTGPQLVTVARQPGNRPSKDRVTGGNRESAPFPVTVTGPPLVTVLRPTWSKYRGSVYVVRLVV